MKKITMALSTTTIVCISGLAYAESPVIKSATPIIYLADNLDEKDKLGWCIDTEGRGFAESLQAHSCKPHADKANDTQFSFDPNQHRGSLSGRKYYWFLSKRDQTWPDALHSCQKALHF